MDMNFAIAVAMMVPAVAIGIMGYAAFTAMGRNPEAAKDIKGSLVLALAFAEGLGIIAAVLTFVLLNK